jgi:hypothetical protein
MKCVGLLLAGLALQAAAAVTSPDFDRDVRPILSDNCFACHGPDEKRRVANLRLDVRESAFSETKRGKVIVPGDASKSLLYQRITHAETARRMPPASTEKVLTPTQLDTIKRWIDAGAKWETHWAFTAPKHSDPPEVGDKTWVRNPIDRFILARLDKEGLKPQSEADRVTILRRVSFDLTGLPPTRDEVRDFIGDRSPDAYEKQVDRLLASTRYGERMAMQWLDVARYADSHGYHIDSHRDMWPWRDWVINSFNSNMPYDQFTVKQLAGDLLPNATIDDKIATGFNRNHMINFEGGAIPEEYQTEYVADRVETTSMAFLGLTLGCARCHSHKYDPISHKEFYQFFAFFNTVDEEGLDGREGNAKPFLKLPTANQEALQKQLADSIAADDTILKSEPVVKGFEQWKQSLTAMTPPLNRDGLIAHYEFDGSLSDSSGRYQHGRTIEGDPTFGPGRIARAIGFDGQTRIGLGKSAGFEKSDPFSIALWLRYGGGKQQTPVIERISDSKTRRGYELWFDDSVLVGIQRRAAHIVFRMTSNWPSDALVLRTTERFTQSEWTHVVLASDGKGEIRCYVNGKPQELAVVSGKMPQGPIAASNAEIEVGVKEPDAARFSGSLDDLRFYSRAIGAEEAEYIALDYPTRAILSGVGGKVTKAEDERLHEHYMKRVASADLQQKYLEFADLKKQAAVLDKQILSTMVMNEAQTPRDSFILNRGDYQNKGEKVIPGTPAVLPPLPLSPDGTRPNRLTLARWLVDPAHPLTARVAVNRYWQMYFGLGLVKTAENFGSQGDSPSHPELLDWLATEFIASKWDVKAMQRLIVTSAAYRQSSKVTPELLEKDPENRLLARGPRFRLPAESIRDNALAVSGLINPKIGGASVFPYQPAGIWEELAFGDGFSMQTYEQSHDADLYRRSMYTFWKRTAPPAAMLTFDAPDREKCTARRLTTNTPLQALVLLNDPTYLEASRVLAQRMLHESGKDQAQRAKLTFEWITSRIPDRKELAVLTKLARQQLDNYSHDPQAAGQFLKAAGQSPIDATLNPVDLAAWTAVASAIFNLDETVTKE